MCARAWTGDGLNHTGLHFLDAWQDSEQLAGSTPSGLITYTLLCICTGYLCVYICAVTDVLDSRLDCYMIRLQRIDVHTMHVA